MTVKNCIGVSRSSRLPTENNKEIKNARQTRAWEEMRLKASELTHFIDLIRKAPDNKINTTEINTLENTCLDLFENDIAILPFKELFEIYYGLNKHSKLAKFIFKQWKNTAKTVREWGTILFYSPNAEEDTACFCEIEKFMHTPLDWANYLIDIYPNYKLTQRVCTTITTTNFSFPDFISLKNNYLSKKDLTESAKDRINKIFYPILCQKAQTNADWFCLYEICPKEEKIKIRQKISELSFTLDELEKYTTKPFSDYNDYLLDDILFNKCLNIFISFDEWTRVYRKTKSHLIKEIATQRIKELA